MHYSEIPSQDVEDIVSYLKSLKDTPFNISANKVKMMITPLVFSDGWSFIICENYETIPFQSHYLLKDPDSHFHLLSYTPNPFKDNNLVQMNININDTSIEQYLFFYFQIYQTQYGQIRPINHVDDINWKEDLPLISKQSLEKEIQFYPKIKQTDETFNVLLSCLYQYALVEVDITVTADGFVTINDIKTIIDDLPAINFS